MELARITIKGGTAMPGMLLASPNPIVENHGASGVAMRILTAFSCTAAAAMLFQASTAIAEVPPTTDMRLLTADFRVAPNGSSKEVMHAEVQLNDDAAVARSGQMSIPFDASMQKVDIVEAYTLKRNGHKIAVESSAIREQLLPGVPQLPMYSDLRVKVVIFPQVFVGDVVVYTAKITTTKPAIPGQFELIDAFSTAPAFRQVRATLQPPISLPLQVENHGVVFSKRVQNASVIYNWQYSAPKASQPMVSEISVLD